MAQCMEYTTRAEFLKKGLDPGGKNGKKADGKASEPAEESSDEDETQLLTNEELNAAEEEMEAELKQLVGMDGVKSSMRKLCKQLSLDIRRRQEGHAVLDSIRHMIFTGNPGVGKTTISRLVAKLYKQLGVSRPHRVQRGRAPGPWPLGPCPPGIAPCPLCDGRPHLRTRRRPCALLLPGAGASAQEQARRCKRAGAGASVEQTPPWPRCACLAHASRMARA